MQPASGTSAMKEKNGRPGLEKQTLQNAFFTLVLTIATEMLKKKNKGKITDKMCQLIFLKICQQQQK